MNRVDRRSLIAPTAGLVLALGFSTATSAVDMTSTLPPAGDPDSARVITLVRSIPLAVDLARYDLAEAAFASEVTIDYTSLWGGEPQRMTPSQLIEGWRSIVPGFDATWHELGDVRVEVREDEAMASAQVDGRHWIGDRLWRPIGTYHWSLRKLDGAWKVTAMRFAMTQEIGDRALAAEATERAKAVQP